MSLIRTETRGRVGILTFDDPAKRNAVTLAMNDEIVATVERWEADPDVGAMVITGASPAFCAGADLDDLLADQDPSGMKKIYEGFLRIAHTSLPTVAAVNGAAVGAGFNMVLAADVVIAARNKARFDSRFLQIGLHPGGGHTWRLRSITGRQTTMAMVLFSEVVHADEAQRLGLVWKVVDDTALIDEAVALAGIAADRDKELVARTKATILSLDEITESNQAVDQELYPQIWSMQQGTFRTLVERLHKKISSHD